MKQMPKIEKVMTPMPHSVGRDISIKKAMELMRQYSIRHLPVQHGGDLLGVVTDRDIKLAASFEGASELTVEDVMTPDPFTVMPHAPLDAVTSEMAEHKYGCAIIRQGNGKVVGIFTAVDALRYMSEMMREHYRQVQ